MSPLERKSVNPKKEGIHRVKKCGIKREGKIAMSLEGPRVLGNHSLNHESTMSALDQERSKLQAEKFSVSKAKWRPGKAPPAEGEEKGTDFSPKELSHLSI